MNFNLFIFPLLTVTHYRTLLMNHLKGGTIFYIILLTRGNTLAID